jgi:Zn-dependent protease
MDGAALSKGMDFLLSTAYMGIMINLTLGWFNLMPFPPLDGGHILAGLLPESLARKFYSCGKYALIVIVLLVVSGAFRHIMGPLVEGSARIIAEMLAIPSKLMFL